MTEVQTQLYQYYLAENPVENGQFLFQDFTALRKIWTHCRTLHTSFESTKRKEVKNLAKLRAQGAPSLQNQQTYDKRVKKIKETQGWWTNMIGVDEMNSLMVSFKFTYISLFQVRYFVYFHRQVTSLWC